MKNANSDTKDKLCLYFVVLQFILKCSHNGMLDHNGTLHNVAKWRDAERFEQATENSLNSLETFVEGWLTAHMSIHSVPVCIVFKSKC